MYKIGIIVSRLNVVGGTQRQSILLARELIAMGHAVTIYTFKYDRGKSFFDLLEGIPVVSLSERYPGFEKKLPKIFGLFTRPSFFVHYRHKLQSAQKLAHLIDPNTDFINPHGHFSYRVCYYVKKDIANIPSVWMLNTMPLLTWSVKRKLNTDPTFRISLVKRMLYRMMDVIENRKFVSSLNDIMVLDDRGRDTVRDLMGRDAHVIRSGVDVELFPYRPRKFPSGRQIKILTVAILSPHRRFEDVIEAIDIVRRQGHDITLSVISDWSNAHVYYERLQGLIRVRKLENVIRFLGRVSDEKLISHYRNDDIFIFCNHLHPWGLAVFEAMACGMPVVVSSSSGASEVLTHGENALITLPKDPKDIASAIKTLIDDAALFEKLSCQGRGFVEKEISWPRYAKEVVSIAKGVMVNSGFK